MGMPKFKDLPADLFVTGKDVEFSPSADGDFYDISPEDAVAGRDAIFASRAFNTENLVPINWALYE
jgi:hypothetical protein